MYDIIFAVLLSAFLVIEGIFEKSNTLCSIRLALVITLLPALSVLVIIEFFFMGGGDLLILIIAIGWLVFTICGITNAKLN